MHEVSFWWSLMITDGFFVNYLIIFYILNCPWGVILHKKYDGSHWWFPSLGKNWIFNSTHASDCLMFKIHISVKTIIKDNIFKNYFFIISKKKKQFFGQCIADRRMRNGLTADGRGLYRHMACVVAPWPPGRLAAWPDGRWLDGRWPYGQWPYGRWPHGRWLHGPLARPYMAARVWSDGAWPIAV